MSGTERCLQGIQLAARPRKSLDGLQVVAIRLNGQHDARTHGLAVEQYGASAAHAMLAANVRPGQLELLPDEIAQQQPGLDVALVRGPVDGDSDLQRSVGYFKKG